MKVLDRYILSEFAKVITVSTLAIIGIFFGTVEFQHALEVMSKLGLPWDTFIIVDALQLPISVIYCMPAAVVCAAALVWIRQHQSREILALQLNGVSRARILAPFLVTGLLTGIFGYVVGDCVAPNSRYLSQKLLIARLNNSDRPFPGKQEIVLKDDRKMRQWLIFGDTTGNSTRPFVGLDFTGPNGPVVVYSTAATWHRGVWKLGEGAFCELPAGNEKGLHYKFGQMEVGGIKSIARSVDNAPKTMFDRTIAELRDEIERRQQHGGAPPEMLVQFYRRFSQPLSCVLLLFAAAPLTLFRRARWSTASQYLYVGIVVVSFFVLSDITYAMGENARMAPWLAAFLPSVILGITGLSASWIMNRA